MVKENIYICKHDVENKKRLRVEVKDKGIQEVHEQRIGHEGKYQKHPVQSQQNHNAYMHQTPIVNYTPQKKTNKIS